jgi:hypothetical protein
MIINKKIILNTFGNRRLDYFKNLGYDTSGDTFEISIENSERYGVEFLMQSKDIQEKFLK